MLRDEATNALRFVLQLDPTKDSTCHTVARDARFNAIDHGVSTTVDPGYLRCDLDVFLWPR